MFRLFQLFARRRRPEHGPVPQLLPEWRVSRERRIGSGIRLRRLGGPLVLTPRGGVPRLRGIEAIRGVCLARWRVRHVELLLDGKVVRIAPARAVAAAPRLGLGKYVFNVWHDFSGIAPGLHRLAVRTTGLAGRLGTRRRWVMIEPPPAIEPDSDAFVPRASNDPRPPDEIVAALPSMVRSTRRSALPNEVRSVLAIRADQLGDLVVSVPGLLRLRGLFPDARLTGLVTAANADLAQALGLFDELVVTTFADADRALNLAEQERLRGLLAGRFDLAVDCGEGARSRLLLLLADAPFRYGFRHGDHDWLDAAFEFNARDPANRMEVMPPSAKLLALVEALGTLRPAAPMRLPLAGGGRLAAFGLAPGERFLVLHTGARLTCSRWPGFGELTTLLLARTPHRIVVFTHGDPAKAPPDPSDRLLVIDHRLPFADFDALLGSCAVFVGNDSGPKHLAALRGAKVVSLHMARLNWNEWGQEGEGLIVSRRVPCAGCNVGDQPDECGRDYTCIRAITPEEVCAAVLSLL